eukprot:SM000012S25348  [mRNA]  locus=s12:514191:517415:- [translate_table: standard]
MLDCRTHLLHGVLHANGFGHLLRVNGRERGSPHATGRDLMSLWDRICGMLRARRVSVMDVSKKLGLDLRLLHSSAHGMPWYGRWGYVFGHGSFGIQPGEYAAAVEAVRSAPLTQLVSHFMGSDHELLGIVALYQRLAKQAGGLATFGDLMRFMLELLQRPSPLLPSLPAPPPSPAPSLAAAAAQGSPSNSHHRRSAPASPSFPPSPVMLGGPYHTLHSAGGSFGSGSHLSGPAAVAAMGSPKVLTPNRWQTASGGGIGGGGGGSGSAAAQLDRIPSVNSHMSASSPQAWSPVVAATGAGCGSGCGLMPAVRGPMPLPTSSSSPALAPQGSSAASESLVGGHGGSSGNGGGGGHHGGSANGGGPPPPSPETPCRWQPKRLEQATGALLDVLRDVAGRIWLSRQALREGARCQIGDTGLLDYVLKGFYNKAVGDQIIRRRFNPSTRMLEYRLEDYHGSATLEATDDGEAWVHSPSPAPPAHPTAEIGRAEILRDLRYMYRTILEGTGRLARRGGIAAVAAIPNAARIVLDTKQVRYALQSAVCDNNPAPSFIHKVIYEWASTYLQNITFMMTHFIKDYEGELPQYPRPPASVWEREDVLRVLCVPELADKNEAAGRNRSKDPPPELVLLPATATIGDLRRTASKAFRDVYLILEDFEVESLPQLDGLPEKMLLKGQIDTRSPVLMQGLGADLKSQARYEGGTDEWSVDCVCETRDDDGERMVSCDVCEVWQHTRCVGIADKDPPPAHFVCRSCSQGHAESQAAAVGSGSFPRLPPPLSPPHDFFPKVEMDEEDADPDDWLIPNGGFAHDD